MTKKISVTVIIPVYNREKTLEATLNAVINQSIAPDEIIVIDNNSTDNTRSICLRYEKKCKLIFNPENYGAAISRNIALKSAKSEYVLFIDSDDIPTYNYLESRLKKIIENKTDIVYGSWAPVEINNNVIKIDGLVRQARKTFMPLTMFCLGWMLFIPNCMIKRSLLIEVDGYPEYFAHDYGLLCKLLLKTNKISFTSESLLLVRQHPNNQISGFLTKEKILTALEECYKDCYSRIHKIKPFPSNFLPLLILKIRLSFFRIDSYCLAKNRNNNIVVLIFLLIKKIFLLNNLIYKILSKIYNGHTLPLLLKASPFNKEHIREIELSGYIIDY